MKKRQAEWEEKAWGRVQHMFYNSHVGVSYLEVERGFCCSKHKHNERTNMFFVHSGQLVVEVWDLDWKMYLLNEGDSIEVPEGLWHRFRVLMSGKVTEVYRPAFSGAQVRLDDIDRMDKGGEDNLEELKFALNEFGIVD